jgi:class 3 adenylate cyclase
VLIEDVAALLPWQLRGRAGPTRRVLKTFMFTDIVGSTNLVEALGDEAWDTLLRWHDTTLREIISAHNGEEVSTTGDGFFVGFDSPEEAVAAAIDIQRRLADHRAKHGFAPRVRIGLHASDAQQVAGNFRGKGVHEAARIAALAQGDEIMASVATVGEKVPTSNRRSVELKGCPRPSRWSPSTGAEPRASSTPRRHGRCARTGAIAGPPAAPNRRSRTRTAP